MNRVLAIACVLSMAGVAACAQPAANPALNTPFKWPTFDEAVAAAAETGKPVLIDIYAPWCGWCAKMQAEVYGNETLALYMRERFEYGRLNIDDGETRHVFRDFELTSQELGYALGAQGTPTTVFMDGNTDFITKLDGYWDLDSFGPVLKYIGSGAYRTQSYEDYTESVSTSF